MEIEVQKFVSSKKISKEREQIKEARERILRDAERKADQKISRDEEFRARGDDKWMLPELESKLKKKKRKKKKKKKDGGSDSDEWVESETNKRVSSPEAGVYNVQLTKLPKH